MPTINRDQVAAVYAIHRGGFRREAGSARGEIGWIATSAIAGPIAILLIVKTQGKVSLAEVLVAVLGVNLGIVAVSSLARGPKQFLVAMRQRVRYALVLPCCLLAIIATRIGRVALLLFKISCKLIVAAIGGLAYLIMPTDLIPDFLLGPGQIDDIGVIVTLAIWIMSDNCIQSQRVLIRMARPTTPFP